MALQLSTFESDPLTLALAPPIDESPAAREDRERRERDARKVSQQIDDSIGSERAALRKRQKSTIKVLLLGQSESGKSTTIKNFQLAYARDAWLEERAAWRAVVYLNLVRSVNRILDVITAELDTASHTQLTSIDAATHSEMTLVAPDDLDTLLRPSEDTDATHEASPPPSNGAQSSAVDEMMQPTKSARLGDEHMILKLRLGPLKQIQRDLEVLLGSSSSELTDVSGTFSPAASPFPDPAPLDSRINARRPHEFYIRSSVGWKTALEAVRPRSASGGDVTVSRNGINRPPSAGGDRPRMTGNARQRKTDEAADVIAGCREDIKRLWNDPAVRKALVAQKIRMEESPGFFLNDVDRIADSSYEPSDGDVVRARLRTLGVQEYVFNPKFKGEHGRVWHMYDVAGARTTRAAWLPYFDNVNAIIFLAPVSCFNEALAEDKRVNRLQDSTLLWKAVCSSPLLADVQLILFLNKIDLLEHKLRDGKLQIREFIPSYKDRPNTAESLTDYLKTKFKDTLRNYSPKRRPFFVHLTSVIDTEATRDTIINVQEGIMRNALKSAQLAL
ncbi:hypothetical protein PLICRDRAFT_52763 [Plicaturopsis crispa FD-325 SS-3]|nr:hypothetical protein PLICRDRAFT_52763 [Plicaturopsis crispa FD-325 SS-3]